MKRSVALLLAAVLCLSVAACSGETAPEENTQEIRVKVTNTVNEPLSGMGVTWYIGDDSFHSSGMKTASGKAIGNCEMGFVLKKEDIPEDADLTQFGIKFSVTELSGASFDICTVYFPAELGTEYAFELRDEDGCYAIWSESEGALFRGNRIEDETAISIALTGPWHLDSEKNDLTVLADRFPGYAEWGAGMELKDDGQMSWYIGAAGGCGTYTVEGELLHAALVADADQKDMPMDLRILVENEEAVLEMDYQGMTVCWVYGDREDVPADSDDENREEVSYPGEDVVQIVNLRGDETTVYKLADGTYMDRSCRVFLYNGTDTWTDEGGAEWNEIAKD